MVECGITNKKEPTQHSPYFEHEWNPNDFPDEHDDNVSVTSEVEYSKSKTQQKNDNKKFGAPHFSVGKVSSQKNIF